MLTNTFIHIQGIGAITEKRLWVSVLRDWASLLAKKGFLQIIDSKMLPIIGFSFLLDNNFISLNFILKDLLMFVSSSPKYLFY
jgi:hypothetical protein